MRVTKAVLEAENEFWRRAVSEKDIKIKHLTELLGVYKSISTQPVTAMTIALERTTDAVAHTLGNLMKGS